MFELKELPTGYWNLIMNYLPNYCRRDDVLKSNILTRYISGYQVFDYDIKFFNFKDRDLKSIQQELFELDSQLFAEAYQNFAAIHGISEDSYRYTTFILDPNSTLFNAGPGTNFIYRVVPPVGITIDCNTFNAETYCDNGKIAKRFAKLKNELNCQIIFKGVQSKCLDQNLKTIDYSLPQLLAQLLQIRFLNNITDLKRCTEILTEQNPLGFDSETHGPVYEYKVKRFLQDCAMGMTPETPWLGLYDANGGQIIVKEDGEIVCYHIYELNRFMEYLFKSTKFESPSTSEDENHPGYPRANAKKKFFYGWIYEEDGEYRIKLNLQIRFK